MQRSTIFHHPAHEPLREDPAFALNDKHTRGPFAFLNPTRARLDPTKSLIGNSQSQKYATSQNEQEKTQQPSKPPSPKPSHNKDELPASSIQFEWRSRDNRKGRHKLLVTPAISNADTHYLTPNSTATFRAVGLGIWRMFTYFPYWDVSWLVAVIFTLGSVMWVINGFFAWLPIVRPDTEFDSELDSAGWTAFIGATIFVIGSVLLMIEAVNENRAGCFGWALEQVFEGAEKGVRWQVRAEKRCRHHHSNKKNFVGKGHRNSSSTSATATGMNSPSTAGQKRGEAAPDTPESASERMPSVDPSETYAIGSGKSWQWYPSLHDLTTHYIYELGFLACSFQMFGATVFWIAGFTSIPQIFNTLESLGQKSLNYGYWIPQIVGGAGFIASSFCFMLETQRKWYIPAWGTLGWHIGVWNLIGAFGFTLCGALGPAYWNAGAQYQAALSTFWGSWAFLIGSVVQWYESLDTHPVEEKKDKERGKENGEAEEVGQAEKREN